MFYCCGITNKGIRENNEDAFLINKKVITDGELEDFSDEPLILAVADGVAGEKSGEIASSLILNLLSKLNTSEKTDIRKKILDFHNEIRKHGIIRNKMNMQSTLCALILNGKSNPKIINVGDSKLFRYRNGIINQLSTDQSFVQLLFEQGEIAEHEKRKHVHRNIIFPVIGNVEEEPTVDITEIEGGILDGDVILIMSDGVADYVTKGDIESVLALPKRLSKRIKTLVELALKNGSSDNSTVVAVTLK